MTPWPPWTPTPKFLMETIFFSKWSLMAKEMVKSLFWHHCLCFVPASTRRLLSCSDINKMAFVLFQCQQHEGQNWPHVIRQGEVTWIFTRQGQIKSHNKQWLTRQGNYHTWVQTWKSKKIKWSQFLRLKNYAKTLNSRHLLIHNKSAWMVWNGIKPMKSSCFSHFIVYFNICTESYTESA